MLGHLIAHVTLHATIRTPTILEQQAHHPYNNLFPIFLHNLTRAYENIDPGNNIYKLVEIKMSGACGFDKNI
jgi:hypothetical protein